MGLKIGIVGLPNVGKSTLFNALLKRQAAYVANFPFATIDPNVGVVPVPDERLEKLADTLSEVEGVRPPIVPATVEFVDIAGLIAGAHKGEGLGNKFLSHIREVDAICHVVRVFPDSDIIKEGSVDPKSDFEIIRTELDLADFETLEKHRAKKKQDQDEESLPLFKKKPFLVVLNVAETDLRDGNKLEIEYAEKLGLEANQVVAISAKIESELSTLTDSDQKTYMEELGIKTSGLERLIKKAFQTLGLITFLTAGEKEVRAWTIPVGITAQNAAGVIHTDFIKNFIKADVVDFNDFVHFKGWKNCRENGKVRSEGRDYIVKDGDVIEFKIGN